MSIHLLTPLRHFGVRFVGEAPQAVGSSLGAQRARQLREDLVMPLGCNAGVLG
jgi:hypothetical protein